MTLFGNRIFTDVIRDKIILALGWTLNPMTGTFIRGEERTHPETHSEKGHVKKMELEFIYAATESRNTRSYQKLEETKKDPPLDSLKGM